ncbi:MAG: cytochrome c maturation protein CcmE [Alphaproteobacteria bacterium]|nr:cytochrome c maturation protein CcmE [Alphaproteobacteria bacterium]
MSQTRPPRRPLTAKRRRLYLLLAAGLTLGGAAALILNAFQDSLVFFLTPTELKAKAPPRDRVIRIGGLVEEGSWRKAEGGLQVRFAITDLTNRVEVTYRGILPDLFREGQGVVAQGRMGTDGVFAAQEVLAKHDETYMPKEVADALKKSGQWKPGQKGAAGAGGKDGKAGKP